MLKITLRTSIKNIGRKQSGKWIEYRIALPMWAKPMLSQKTGGRHQLKPLSDLLPLLGSPVSKKMVGLSHKVYK
ncbi:Putative protein [Zobellia galactanivorans]|uniref:Uncharacterized protein n=1 Tax=Zobellia galactanivorans (strain DSM 12802 / CCUG 47099 / CIP 106680 / NCIMB 13871 / Dsij) TaxID=63186 RepID=G0LA65_ZOBGA|nr:Putative protein [Zobellia galactanivorans]